MHMNRTTFLSIAAVIALAVGTFASLFPTVLLESKGVPPSGGARVWMTEVGVLLLALGLLMFLVRRHPASPALRAIFAANALVQVGLLLVEAVAFQQEVITKLSGILPNCILHLVLTAGFVHYWLGMLRAERAGG